MNITNESVQIEWQCACEECEKRIAHLENKIERAIAAMNSSRPNFIRGLHILLEK